MGLNVLKGSLYRYLMLFLVAFFVAKNSSATHLRAGEVIVERLNCNDLTFQITVVVYLDSKSHTPFGGTSFVDGSIIFGDGSTVVIPETQATLRPDLGIDISIATYTIAHTYQNPGIYKITYYERDRSSGVLNMINSEDTAYSSSITINTEANTGCNHFPRLGIPPVDLACSGISFFHNAGAYDLDGDSLSYALTIPESEVDVDVDGYVMPDDPRFYVNYNTANETGTGPPNFSINPVTGLITWNAPGMQGQYNIAFEIIEWRRIASTGELVKLSTTVRDMQIIVSECDNIRPDVLIPNDTCIIAGTVLHATIFGVDPEYDSVKIEPFSEIFNFPAANKPATYTPSVPAFKPSFPPATLEFNWNTDCLHIREQSYQVVFKISDKSPDGTLTTFKTWNIKVIAPPPTWKSAALDIDNRSAALEWNDYTCENAGAIQVWRRVDDINYTPGLCVTGIPALLGYELVGTIDPLQKKFTDINKLKGLAPGARYCYRLVATFNAPAGGKSRVSEEICIGPIQIDAPVITHVTVEKTDSQDGAIRVSWRSPLSISTVQFPKPYQYEIYRADGLSDSLGLALKVSERIQDTTFLDTGIKTEEMPYNYKIIIYARTKTNPEYRPIDTSAVASSVWLSAVPGIKEIELNWIAIVPWTNFIQNSPWHLIYRGSEGASESEMVLIDSVDVSQNGFTYVDVGHYKNIPLDENLMYCYRIMTRGSYGNPKIAIQENFSQQVCLYPQNNLLPCKPLVTVALTNCEQFIQEETCDQLDFSNHVSWEPALGPGCRSDIISYNVYGASGATGAYALLASNVTDMTYVEEGLSSYARCYRVTAVDTQGHISELSDPACNDNCPYFDLPNIFTPNGDGCNDRFSAYRPEDEATCSSENISRCPQFVEKVSLRVYNRWGNPVYGFDSGNGNSINIDWDGRDDSGSLLDAAVYYYSAEVTFTTTDPEKRQKKIRGWVKLIR